jgi:glycosyltransferase involved in cell wall biosynthesis
MAEQEGGAKGAQARDAAPPVIPAALKAEVLRRGRIAALARTGLFDAEHYRQANPEAAASGADLLEHFHDQGWKEGRKPNFYFEPLWYAAQNPDVTAEGLNPLFHYAFHGDAEDRRAAPFFDTAWYRRIYRREIPAGQTALAHYLAHRRSGRFSPLPEFDVAYYLAHSPDVAEAGLDPFEHFWRVGYTEGRNPSAEFDVRFYAQRYLRGEMRENPFGHWLAHRHQPGVFGRLPGEETSAFREVRRFTQPGLDFEEVRPLPPTAHPRAKLLAYYLPQYHPIPENDAWWGRGFTEWTNVARGLPRFRGHYQPRIPRDLGFYSLGGTEVMQRQIRLAKGAGLGGFVFYFYWFNGRRLLEKPVEAFLRDRALDMPFALMWANENWTRRWDGAEADILISQDYRTDDDARLVAEFARHFADPRYIRLQDNRPLLMVYRAALIPEGRATVERWRALFRSRFGEDPILVMAQAFGETDPRALGLDGAVEFPPHKLTQTMAPVNHELDLLDTDFSGKAYRYEALARESLDEDPPPYPLIKTIVPGWDNDARRQGSGVVIAESSPARYEAWLAALVDRARANPFFGTPLVCINAWNEWCEGAYLEPDLHYGGAYLNATGRAVAGLPRGVAEDVPPKLLLVGHDAFPAGAQQLLLEIGRGLRRQTGIEVAFLLLGGGALEDAYRKVAPTHVVTDAAGLAARVAALAAEGFPAALVNSLASGRVVAALTAAGLRSVLLVHELPRLIRERGLAEQARLAVATADHVVFPAPMVRDAVLGALGLPPSEKAAILPQGLYGRVTAEPEAAERVRQALGIAPGEPLVLGIGYADLRKGFDHFLQLWRLLGRRGTRRVHACWLGDMDGGLRNWLEAELEAARRSGTFHLPGRRDDVAGFLAAAQALALPSREDPFPSVALEALAAGLPVVAFDGAGGIPDLLRDEAGLGAAVPAGDVVAMAEALEAQMRADTAAARARRRAVAARRFAFPAYLQRLLGLALPDLGQVSAVVPNYNYAAYLAGRLGSVFGQTQPLREVIVLDDASTDDSLGEIRQAVRRAGRAVRLVTNERNSGSVFAQWARAADLAHGDFVWIAEADDLAEPELIRRLLARMRGDPAVALAFADSRAIAADGAPLWDSHKAYYATLGPGTLASSGVFEGTEFVGRCLAVKNLIVNASAVLWRRDALRNALALCGPELAGWRVAGDWRLYLEALRAPGARIAYEATPLNIHRRHAASVTGALDAARHVEEIARCQALAAEFFPAIAETVAEAQRGYLREVAAQLGVPPPAGLEAALPGGENAGPV